jgi:ABC-type antimicrobial peptide transport system permease subunit
MLVQTSQNDPVTLTSLAGLLAAVAMCAVIVPALRASRIDPSVALRRE